MSLISYFNYYFPFFRGNSKIIEYFNNPYNNAIKKLSEEGYNFIDEFINLIQAYSNNYSLNNKELSFKMDVIVGYFKNHEKFSKIQNKLDYEIRLANSYISNFKESISNLKLQCNIKYLKNQCTLLSLDIAEMKPIYEAVVVRICVKKLLEIFIKKNIKIIEIENYSPKKESIDSYLNSLKSNYVYNRFNKTQNIEKEISEIAKKMDSSNNNINNSSSKIFPKLVIKNNKDKRQIMQLLTRIKKLCNEIIHPNEQRRINFNIKNYIDGEDNDENIETDYISYNIINSEISNDNNNPIYYSPENLAQFIIFGKHPYIMVTKLKELHEKVNKKYEEIFNELGEIKDKKNKTRDYINKLLSTQKDINNILKELILSDKNYKINLDKSLNISEHLEKNKLSIYQFKKMILKMKKNIKILKG